MPTGDSHRVLSYAFAPAGTEGWQKTLRQGWGPGRCRASARSRRSRSLTGTEVPRGRLEHGDGKTTEWQSNPTRAYQRRTLAADALIASSYLVAPTRAGCVGRSGRCSAGR
jgi:hypothetical protein